ELEQAFRQNWRSFKPDSYAYYVEQVEPDQRLELLARLLSVELEFAFQPPSCNIGVGPDYPTAHATSRDSSRLDNDTRGEMADGDPGPSASGAAVAGSVSAGDCASG